MASIHKYLIKEEKEEEEEVKKHKERELHAPSFERIRKTNLPSRLLPHSFYDENEYGIQKKRNILQLRQQQQQQICLENEESKSRTMTHSKLTQIKEEIKRDKDRMKQLIQSNLRRNEYDKALLERSKKTEVPALSESIASLQSVMISENQKVKVSEQSKSRLLNRIDSSTKEIFKQIHEHPFLQTEAFKTVSKLLERNNMVFLTGLPGEGKTSIAYRCAFQYQMYKAMKPFIVKHHRDWKTCIFPDNKLFVIVEDFCEKDAFSDSFDQNVEYHLDGMTYNIYNQGSVESNKVVVVLRKEILHFLRPSLKKVYGFSEELIVDLSSEDTGYRLSDSEKDAIWKMYNGLSKCDVSYKKYFGFPKICEIGKDIFFSEKAREFYCEQIRQIEPEFFLTLAEICLNGGRICIKDLECQERVRVLINSLLKQSVHELGRQVSSKLTFAAVPLIGVYLTKGNENGESFLEFLHIFLNQHVASVILERNAVAVFQLCSLQQLHFFKRTLMVENFQMPKIFILQSITNRITYELRFNSTDNTIRDVANLEEWLEDDFIDVCLADENLSQSISGLTPLKQEYLIECVAKAGTVNLMKVIYSFLKRKKFLTICSKREIILTASETGTVAMYELFVDLGLRLHRDDAISHALFLKLVEKNHFGLLLYIVKSMSLDKTVLEKNSFSAFRCGAENGSKEMMTFLIELGCNPHVRSNKNETILHMVAMYGNVSILVWFYNKYPDQRRITTDSGRSILHYSACNKDVEAMLFLLEEVQMDPYEKTLRGESILHIAVRSGNIVAIKKLVDRYVEMEAMQDINGYSALHIAAKMGNLETVKFLSLQKDLCKLLTKEGENILHCASKCKNLATFEFLVKEFFLLKNDKTNDGLNLLHTASAYGSIEIVKCLIRQGYDVRKQTTKGQTAIHCACLSGNIEVVKFLSQKYPDQLHALDSDGFDPVLTAAKSNSLKTVQYLIMMENWGGQTSRKGQDILHVACQYSTIDIVKYLCEECKIGLENCDYVGKSPLHYSAMNPSIEVIQYLLKIGSNHYARSTSMQTVLHFACFNENTDVLKYLLKELPDFKYRTDARGYSILHYSCEAGNIDAFELCLKEGFQMRLKTIYNLTPLEIALLNKKYLLVEAIIKKYKRQKWHSCIGKIIYTDIANYQETCLKSLNRYEYLDLAILPQKLEGKCESKIQAMCLIDTCMRDGKESFHCLLRKRNDIFKRMYQHTKYDEEIQTFQETLLEIGISEALDWYIDIAFLYPEVIPDYYLKIISREMETYKEKNVVKAVANGFCKIFWMKYREVLNICSVWAGYDCSMNEKRQASFDTIVVITDCERNLGDINIHEFFGLKIYFRNVKYFSAEAKEMMKYENGKLPSIQLKKEDIKNLMSRHSNITLISASTVKSKGFVENHLRKPKELHTVVIYCRVKGIIPVGEELFPTQIRGCPVDIRESAVMLAAGHEGLRMGDKVGPEDRNSFGTVGGFVDIDTQKKGFITCAHIMHPSSVDNMDNNSESVNRNRVRLIDRRGTHVIGKVVREAFNLDSASEVDVSTDAVLIELHDRYPETGHFTLNLDIQNIRQADFQRHDELMFTNGETATIQECRSKLVMKVGASTGLTRGYIHFDNATAFIKTHTLQNGIYSLHGQIEVKPHRCSDFITEGDSGSFIFLIGNGHPPTLKCIGMAVAETGHGTCLMTPIETVLASLNLTADQLSKFQHDPEEEDIFSKMFNDLKKEMRNQYSETNSNISGLRAEVRESINRLETRAESVEDRVLNIETDNFRCNMS